MIELIKKIYRQYKKGAKANDLPFSKYGFFGERLSDPVYNCEVYKEKGCAHIDGMLCDMKTCKILKDHSNEQLICPVCGWLCFGKGAKHE